ncbi:MAG: tRNA pseudouridine(38-40) synthase TruA [Bacteroidetes bacterium]|nr:MAG: tRNA pseudouridine(38-40) synthase TruA [Bacteroidota bacterium]
MPRYFLEVAYKGTEFSGFQIQDNANSVQTEIEKAFGIYFRRTIDMTGSSRTDAGVHALKNFFHFDFAASIDHNALYHINAILPADIVCRGLYEVDGNDHCRFDALSRRYEYRIHRRKDPFLRDRSYYYPYALNTADMKEAALMVLRHNDFTSFSKRNTQTKTFNCQVKMSRWTESGETYVFEVEANRFLRGMVRGLVGTMLQVGRGKIDVRGFESVLLAKDNTKADFSVPGHGLFLVNVEYPEGMLKAVSQDEES